MSIGALILSAFLQFGILNGGAIVADKPSASSWDFAYFPPAYATLGIGARYNVLYFETSVRTDVWAIQIDNWYPFDVAFQIGGGIKLDDWLTIGIRHTCYHPITPYSVVEGYMLLPNSEGACNDIFVRVELHQ